ncbi:MAG: sugar ABC transporter ATP-binding protein [Desulfarculaceae bacterium]|jgi:ribose transport system ATP-binding protein
MNAPPFVEIKHLRKRYGATVALDDVSFSIQPGEVCGLLGENGAGKSTVVKILSGVVRPDKGVIRLGDQGYQAKDCQDAKDHGVATAYQELSLIPTLSVAINLFLPKPERNAWGVVSNHGVEQKAAKVLQEFGVLDISPSVLVEDLPLGQRQRIEIVRAMLSKPRLLLLDEPTAALSDREWLFNLIDQFVLGGSSIIYISHKLDEVQRVCQHCVILRNGRKALEARVKDLSPNQVFSCMAGRSVVEVFPEEASSIQEAEKNVLQVDNLSSENLQNIGFCIRSGEILGVAALEGQGQSSLFKALVGLAPLKNGQITLNGLPCNISSPRNAWRAGLVLVPEERKTEGIFPDLTTRANISLPEIDRLTTAQLVQKDKEKEWVNEKAAKVDLGSEYIPLPITSLSGGNQQKALLARSLLTDPQCLLLFDPTRGVDVITKQTIYKIIREFVQGGKGVLFYSTELDELVHLCDRCLVLYQNAVVAVEPRGELSQKRLLSLATGHLSSRSEDKGAAAQRVQE